MDLQRRRAANECVSTSGQRQKYCSGECYGQEAGKTRKANALSGRYRRVLQERTFHVTNCTFITNSLAAIKHNSFKSIPRGEVENKIFFV